MRYLVGFVLALMLSIVVLVGCGGGDADVCESFCAKHAECGSGPLIIDDCAQFCAGALGESAKRGAECEAAVTDAFACVADVPSCEQALGWWYEVPADSYPCKAADDIADAVCAFEVPP
ncbi:MAG: hypothetical protein HKN10_03880 [Myxococcales bacterium]|nr:hypothetical protein [Myxococcales bacterium]